MKRKQKRTSSTPISSLGLECERTHEFLSSMWSRRHRSRAVLGAAIDEAFEKVRDAAPQDSGVRLDHYRDIVRGGTEAAREQQAK